MGRGAGALAVAVAVTGAVALTAGALLRVPRPADPAGALAAGEEMLASARRVVAVVAHPDDAEWYAGGTLSLLARRGAKVTVVVATDGERGPRRGLDGDPRPLAEIRRQEQRAAAREIGYGVVFLGLPDRGLGRVADLPRRIGATLAPLRPDAILTFDARYPGLPYVHPDHQAVGRAVMRLVAAGDPAVRGAAVYLFHTRRPDTAVDIGAALPAKLRALAAHRSQGFAGASGGTAGREAGNPPAGLRSGLEAGLAVEVEGAAGGAAAGTGAPVGPGFRTGEAAASSGARRWLGFGAGMAARHSAALGRVMGVGFAEVFRRPTTSGPGGAGERPGSSGEAGG